MAAKNMTARNCWEYKKSQRQLGGINAMEMGECYTCKVCHWYKEVKKI